MNTTQETLNDILPKTPSIRRESSCYRSMICLGKKIARIVLHNGEKILYTKQSGWLEHQTDPASLYYGSRDVVSINLPVRKANKLNLAKKDNFLLHFADSEKSYFESGTALYIYVSDFMFIQTIKQNSEDGLSMYFADLYEFSLPCEVLIPEYDRETEKLIYKPVPMKMISILTNYRTEFTTIGESVNRLTSELNAVIGTDSLSTYQVLKLVQKFNITNKE